MVLWSPHLSPHFFLLFLPFLLLLLLLLFVLIAWLGAWPCRFWVRSFHRDGVVKKSTSSTFLKCLDKLLSHDSTRQCRCHCASNLCLFRSIVIASSSRSANSSAPLLVMLNFCLLISHFSKALAGGVFLQYTPKLSARFEDFVNS